MKHLKLEDIRKQSVKSLSLDSDKSEIESPEFIAAALRRAASSMCPCSSFRLIQTVCESVTPILISSEDEFKESVQQILEALIGNGDLIEEDEVLTSAETKQRGKVLYLRPPSFIERKTNSVFLIGIPPNNMNIFPPELEQRIDSYQHIRRVTKRPDENLKEKLKSIGLIEIPLESWDRRNSIPETVEPAKYINEIQFHLKSNPGSLEGLQILNSNKNVRYYKGRWELPRNQSGFFVARRPQAFGNNLWCYLELQDGVPLRMLDFPVINKDSFGRDEAWRIQMAIDAERNKPQEFTVHSQSELFKQIKFYSPVPSWLQRRWDNLAEPGSNQGCLFSYKFIGSEIYQEINFIKEKLWLVEKN
ncbi:MAG: hypothetical protein ACR2MD_00730 [Aridibacter sp.]